MKSMMTRTSLREIKQSLGRYLAILAIVALGVGFFAGLKITKDVMVASADNYLREGSFFDYRLLSTLGFEEEDVESFAGKEGVRAAEGAFFADAVYLDAEQNEKVIKAHSLTENLNDVTLVAGRMPKKADECVVDSLLYDESAIGSKIVLSENNAEEDLENFAYKEYTITGLVQSTLYIQFERGNTSLGNGRVSGFMYLLPEGFSMEYFTEIYVKFAEDFPLYSDDYDAFLEEKEPLWENYCEDAGERRYQAIVSEAEEKIADAKEELETERADAQKELDDAKQELTEADVDLIDGRLQIADAEKEIEESEKTIAAKETELANAETVLAEQAKQIEDMQASGMYPEQVVAAAKEELVSAQAQTEAGKAEIQAAKEKLAESKAELESKKQELADAQTELDDGWKEYEDSCAEFEEEMTKAEAEIADAEAEIADIEKPETFVLGRETNIGYACFESDSSIVEGISNVFPVFFFLVAALICMTTMNRMVEEQRTQIGVLKALGFGEGAIMGKYLFYSGSAAMTGCFAGYFLGTWLFPWVIWTAYGIMYRLGDVSFVFDGKLFVISLIASLACSMGTTWISCSHELREVAAGLMRPKAPKAGKRIFLERIPFLWKRLKFLQKVSARNIVRYKKRFFMMVLGISGCTALLVTGFGIRDSVTDIADQQFEEISVYQVGVTMKNGITGENDAALQEFSDLVNTYGGKFTFGMETSMDLVSGNRVKSISLVVAKEPEKLGDYIALHTKKDEPIPYPKAGEAVICNKLAERYQLRIGDTITLRDENQKEVHAKVSGICENYVYNYVYLNAETYEQAFGEIVYKNIYLNLPDETDAHNVSAAIMKQEGVTAVTVNADTLVRFSGMMSSMDYIVIVIICCAGALAFIVLYNLNNINITERIREIATIKVLGFYKRETSTYVFRENLVLTMLGCVLGLFLGKLLHLYVMHEIDIDLVSFDVRVKAVSYLLSVGFTFLFNWVVNRMMSGKLERIPMAESLKSVD